MQLHLPSSVAEEKTVKSLPLITSEAPLYTGSSAVDHEIPLSARPTINLLKILSTRQHHRGPNGPDMKPSSKSSCPSRITPSTMYDGSSHFLHRYLVDKSSEIHSAPFLSCHCFNSISTPLLNQVQTIISRACISSPSA